MTEAPERIWATINGSRVSTYSPPFLIGGWESRSRKIEREVEYVRADLYAKLEAIRALTPPDITAAAARVLLAAWPTDTSFDAAFAACATAYHGGDQMQDTMDRTLATVSAALRALAEVKP